MSTPRSPAIDGISVLVATYAKHAHYTQRLLDALHESARGLDVPWECIVIDDPPPFSSPEIETICTTSGARYLHGSRRVSTKINLGASHARYNLLLDLGADCFPESGLLAAHVAAMRNAPPHVAGAAGPVRYDGPYDLRWRVADFYGYNACYEWGRSDALLRWAPINVTFLTSMFRAVGGYPEDGWTLSGGDDVALGMRLSSAGKSLQTAPDAGVTTPRSDLTFTAMLKTLMRYGKADAWLCHSFPRGRNRDVNPFPVALAAGTIAAAAATRRPLRVGAPVAALALLAQPSSRLHHYARKARRLRMPVREGSLHVGGAVLMSLAFKLGMAGAAVEKHRLGLLLCSFDYSSRPLHEGLVPADHEGAVASRITPSRVSDG